MKEKIKFLCIAIAIAVVVIPITVIGGRREKQKMYDKGYKDACIDFYKGKLKMELIEQEDGSVIWQKVKEDVGADHRKQRGKSRP